MHIDSISQIPGSATTNFGNELVDYLPTELAQKFEGRQVQLTLQDGANAPGVYVVQGGQWVASGAGGSGSVGPVGPTGPQGEPGTDGTAGPVGPTGVAGSNGPVGPTGPQGLVGPVGPTGPAGTGGATGVPYDVAYFAPTDYALEGLVLAFTATRSVEFGTFSESYAKLAAAVTAATSVSIKKNGAEVGTITYGAGSAVGTFNVASPVALAAGDTLTLGVVSAASNAFGFSCSLKGTAV